MKNAILFILKDCPHCKKFLSLMEDQPIEGVDLKIVDEQEEKEFADSYDYYYVPTLYLEEEKLHEGRIDDESYRQLISRIREKI